MMRATLVWAALVLGSFANLVAQEPARADGWVVIPVDDYRALRLKAYPPAPPPEPPPIEATVTRVDYDLRAAADTVTGDVRLTIDVLRDGWVAVEVPRGLLVRAARLDGRPISMVDLAGGERAGARPTPHVLLSKPGRAVLALDVVVPVKNVAGVESVTLPASRGAVTRVALGLTRTDVDVAVTGGLLAERPQAPDARWVAYAPAGQPLQMTWKPRTQDPRPALPLKWRGHVSQLVGLGEDASPVSATVRVEVVQGVASSIEVATTDGLVVNQVSGALVADWEFRPGSLKVNFLEPVASQAAFTIAGEARIAREGAVPVPLLRLSAAERETGGVAVEVLGAGEISARDAKGLDPADPSDLGDPVAGRDSPSMVAYRYRPQDGSSVRSLGLTVARYTPQAVLVANVEEARYDALAAEEGKTLVRARYGVRNNQRAFLDVKLPEGATLWSASVAGRPVRPGQSPTMSLLLPLQKGRAGEDPPSFAVELTYIQRLPAWSDSGRTVLPLPAIDLPISRTGVVLHYSPRFSIKPEPGVFRVESDTGAFTAVLRDQRAVTVSGQTPVVDELVTQFQKDTAGRSVTGPLPVEVPFPEFGPAVFLVSELTAESQVPRVEFSYKRESRW